MKVKVTYENGEDVTYKVKPRHLVAFEDEFGEFTESVKSAFTLAHLASESSKSFKDWLSDVDDIDVIGAENAKAQADGEEAGEPVPTE